MRFMWARQRSVKATGRSRRSGGVVAVALARLTMVGALMAGVPGVFPGWVSTRHASEAAALVEPATIPIPAKAPPPTAVATASRSTRSATDLDVVAAEAEFIDRLNMDRATDGLLPVVPDARLMAVARWRSEDLVARDYFSHDIGGYNVFRILQERQIDFRFASENLAFNNFEASQTVRAAQTTLMNSTSHREAIMTPEFDRVGVGIAVGPQRKTVYTQLFMQADKGAAGG